MQNVFACKRTLRLRANALAVSMETWCKFARDFTFLTRKIYLPA